MSSVIANIRLMVHISRREILRYVLAAVLLILSIKLPVLGLILLSLGTAVRLDFLRLAIGRFLVGILLALTFNAALYELLSLFRIYPQISIVGFLYAIAGIFLLRKYKPESKKPVMPSFSSIAVVLSFMIAFGILLYPVVKNNSYPSRPERALHLMSAGEDNASHLALFKYAYLHNGYAYRNGSGSSGLISTLVNYPQEAEFNMAWVAKATLGGNYGHNDKVLVTAFYTLASVRFAMLVSLVLLAAFELYETSKRMVGPLASVAAVCIATTGVAIGPLLELMGRGFHPQISAYAFLVAMLYVLIPEIRASSIKKKQLLIGAALFCGLCMSWWFLAPVAAIPLLYFTYTNRRLFKKIAGRNIAVLALIALAAAYPIALSLFSKTKTAFLNEPGGVDVIAVSTLIIYLCGLLVYIFLRGPARSKSKLIMLGLGTWALFTAIIAIYQKITVGHYEYYYYKSLYTLIPLGMPLLIYYFLQIYELLPKTGRRAQLFLSVLVVGLFIVCTLLIKPIYPRVYLRDWFNNLITPPSLEALIQTSDTGAYKDYLFVGECNAPAQYISNRLSGALYLSENGWREEFDLASLHSDSQTTLSLLKQLGESGHIYVYADEGCLSNSISNYILASNSIGSNLKSQ